MMNKRHRNETQTSRKEERRRRETSSVLLDEAVADLSSSSPDEDEVRILDAPSPSPEEDRNEDENGDEVSAPTGENTAPSSTILHTTAAVPKAKKRRKDEESDQAFVNPNEVHAALTYLFEQEREILSLVYDASQEAGSKHASADIFFIKSLLLPPNKWRREQKTSPEVINEHPSHESYRKILAIGNDLLQVRRELSNEAAEQIPGKARTFEDLQNLWLGLQDSVNTMIDSSKNPTRGMAALRNPEGIKQKLEKKEGLFRMNVMGKRVNFAARSVISPDPNIETNEIGIPPIFAKKLTYPEPVTSHNFEELKQAVLNGPETWPGASAVEYENGQIIVLKKRNSEERQALANLLLAPSNATMTGAKNKKVHRHLNNGDVVLMNRQPTLHKPSIMAHKARVLRGEMTIRMHYANCKTYNADFDGDEMNLHFPQNEVARAEALEIADTDHQYLSATAGEPLRGLIQDHISISVWLTCKNTFFTREQYQELLYSAMRPEHNDIERDRIFMIEPTMLKPVKRWTGKQVISTILLNMTPPSHSPIYFIGKTSTPQEKWGPGSEEGCVRVLDGNFITGILDKKQIGPSNKGLIHLVYEAWGSTMAGKLLSILGRLLTKFLSMNAFSCGVEDLLMNEQGETLRAQKLVSAENAGLQVASRYVTMEEQEPEADNEELIRRLESVLRDDEKQSGLEQLMNSQTAELTSVITEACLPHGLYKDFPRNQMQAMTSSGAKGSGVNANFITCNLGQQHLEGRRVPIMVSGRTLPSFKAFDPSVRAGGYILDRFLTGVRPQEYFFHAMAGREGLIDTAVKTSRSGYLQRCLVKGMEGLRAEYDASVRDSDGAVIQALYGEDGLDVTKQRNIDNFPFIARNFLSLYASTGMREQGHFTFSREAQKYNRKSEKEYRKTGDMTKRDPALAVYTPARYAGSNSEIYMRAARQYIDKNEEGILTDEKEFGKLVPRRQFERLVDFNYLKAVIEAGEAVGVVAAQSLGEPSTQMTLNTFHLAGHAAKNVTLGIPRLREILMTASRYIKTPTMSLNLISEMTQDDAKKFASGLSRHSLADIIDQVSVEERVGQGMYPDARIYVIRLSLYPAREYTETYNVTIGDVACTIEKEFVPALNRTIDKVLKKKSKERSLERVDDSDAMPAIGESAGRIQEQPSRPDAEQAGGDSDDEDGGDDDATTTKRKANADEGITYDEPDEDDNEIAREGERDASPGPEPEQEDEDEGYGGSPHESEESGSGASVARTSAKKMRNQAREARIKDDHPKVTCFSFDERKGDRCKITFEYPSNIPKLLLLPVVNRIAHYSVIQEIPGISSATVVSESTDAEPYVLTSGSNLLAMRNYQDILNPHRIRTNDIGAMLRLYGVEAARNTIIAELRNVFESHSIDVDNRHLTLVADYMTRGGGYLSFSRTGMRDKTSSFAKMSFETTMGFLIDAVCDRETEYLDSPSAHITVGKRGRMGTGAFDVLVPLG